MPDDTLWPLAVYVATVIGLIAAVLAVSSVLGERHSDRAKGDPFESGVLPVHRARFRIRAHFYLVAVLFVIFDIEVIFIITWAVIAREGGWAPFIEIAIFIVVLIAALAYLWRVGALDWGPRRSPVRRPPRPSGTSRLGSTGRNDQASSGRTRELEHGEPVPSGHAPRGFN